MKKKEKRTTISSYRMIRLCPGHFHSHQGSCSPPSSDQQLNLMKGLCCMAPKNHTTLLFGVLRVQILIYGTIDHRLP